MPTKRGHPPHRFQPVTAPTGARTVSTMDGQTCPCRLASLSHAWTRLQYMSSNTGAGFTIIGELRDVLQRFTAVDLTALSDAALVDTIRALRPLLCQAQAIEHRIVGAIHTRGAARVEGATSTTAWLRNQLHIPNAAGLVRSAMTMHRLPAVDEAFAAGDINAAHVAAIARVARDIPDEAMAAGAERLLVEQARELTPWRFIPVAGRSRDHLDPDAAERRRRERLEARWLSVDRTFDGAVSIQGMLDPDAGELLITTLTALQAPPKLDDPRTADTRRADALLDLCRLAGKHTPVAGGEKPHVVVTVDLATLRGELDQASLGSGYPIGPATARRLACDASIIPMVLGAPS